MINKIAAIAGAGAILLASATPALAKGNYNWFGGEYNSAVVLNSANSSANTGYNGQYNQATGTFSGKVEVEHAYNTLSTGSAVSSATALTAANTQVGCSVCNFYMGGAKYNSAFVTNGAASAANTGYNTQANNAEGAWTFGKVEVEHTGNVQGTGAAESDANAWTVVNTNWSGWLH